MTTKIGAQQIHGLLAVDKPTGLISKDVSRWLQKRLGKLHIGHVGTLDPGAGGVLPILLGRATRLQDYLLELPKTYEFDVKFGEETDTLDLDGTVVRTGPWEHVTEENVRGAVPSFTGSIEQTPPLYSAVKYKGKALYDYARSQEGDSVPVEALRRKVSVNRFELLSFEPGRATFLVTCSKGTYVRVLAKDLAEKVGSCGTLTRLVRTHAAGVSQSSSFTLEQIEERLGDFASLVVPMGAIDLGIPHWQAARADDVARLRAGQQIVIEAADYLAGVAASKSTRPLTAWAQPLKLLTEKGDAFGIGSVRNHESGRVLIIMKRGL